MQKCEKTSDCICFCYILFIYFSLPENSLLKPIFTPVLFSISFTAQVANLRRERETIISRQQTDNTTDASRVRTLQRENAQLHLKLKGLLTELEEIRAQRENLGLQHDHVARLQTKQLVENAANVRALEVRMSHSTFQQCQHVVGLLCLSRPFYG